MEDRYIYRAKAEYNKRWIVGCLVEDFDHKPAIVTGFLKNNVDISQTTICPVYVDEKTVGQCTGLKDKNGKLIFEGDIVSRYGSVGVIEFGRIIIDVNFEYDCDYFGYYFKEIGNETISIEYCDIEKAEIIGNIHDNQELLEEK